MQLYPTVYGGFHFQVCVCVCEMNQSGNLSGSVYEKLAAGFTLLCEQICYSARRSTQAHAHACLSCKLIEAFTY